MTDIRTHVDKTKRPIRQETSSRYIDFSKIMKKD